MNSQGLKYVLLSLSFYHSKRNQKTKLFSFQWACLLEIIGCLYIQSPKSLWFQWELVRHCSFLELQGTFAKRHTCYPFLFSNYSLVYCKMKQRKLQVHFFKRSEDLLKDHPLPFQLKLSSLSCYNLNPWVFLSTFALTKLLAKSDRF